MKKTMTIVNSLLYRMCVAIGVAALFSVTPNAANATQTVRELFSNLPNNLLASDGTSLNGLTNDFTSVGLSTGHWTNNPPNSFGVQNNNMGYKGSFTVNWVLEGLQGNILPDAANGENGCVDSYPMTTLTNPATMSPYSTWDPSFYATHPLDPGAYVNCKAAGTYWFSVRIEKNYSWSTGDSSAGLGLSTGNGTNDSFVGIGVTRPGTTDASGNDNGDTDYVTRGMLGQAGITGTYAQPDTGGPYLPLATGPAQLYNSGGGAVAYAEAGLVVGRLVTSPSGACELDVVTILPAVTLPAGLPTTPGGITWDATYNFTETNVLTQLLMWMHGPNVEYDAVRMGTTYADVVGLETIGSPVATPFSTVYAGTTVSLSDAYAQVDSANTPMSYQWLKGGTPINPAINSTATNSTLVLSNTVVGDTGDYSVSLNNAFGAITSLVTHVTVNLPVAPFFTAKPVPTTFYVGSSAATFSCAANGTPNFTYQWYQGATPIGSPTTTSALTNSISLPVLTSGSAGAYSVTVQNAYGSTNSGPVNLTVLTPMAGSYAAKVLSYSPWGYWRLDDNVTPTNTALYDEWGGNNGYVVDVSAPTYQVAAAPYSGFPNFHLGLWLTNNVTCRVDLPKLPVWSNSMTLAYWVNNGSVQMCTMNGYGNGYGLYNNSGELIFEWASLGAPSASGGLDTGLNLQTLGYTNGWTFVALVVSPTGANIYLGNNTSNLVTASLTGLALPDSTTAGDTAGLYPPGLGRMEYPFSEDGGGAGYNTEPGTWSDVALFYSSLTPSQVSSLYLAGVGSGLSLSITGKPDGAGNLILNWTPGGVLQQASSVTGTYTDVAGSPVPLYSVPMAKTGNVFYRVRSN
jgi:hypothetical protein